MVLQLNTLRFGINSRSWKLCNKSSSNIWIYLKRSFYLRASNQTQVLGSKMASEQEDTSSVPDKPADTDYLENSASQGAMCKTEKPMPTVKKTMFNYKQYANPESFNFKIPKSREFIAWGIRMGPKTREVKELSLEDQEKYFGKKTEAATETTSTDAGVKVTWIGHASVLVQMDGVNIITDPVFSYRCSPIRGIGPARLNGPPFEVADLPKIDIVLISHNHYDHLDVASVKSINGRWGKDVQWFVPEGLASWMTSSGCENVTELMWWKEANCDKYPGVKVASTPACHWSGRQLIDRFATLWGSWCVIGPKHRFFFAGDTGYPKADPVFKTIGAEYGPFDLAAIPIGAYEPRRLMECQHVNPSEAVMMHQDIKAKKSIGIHWGTFILTDEEITDPPKELEKELISRQIATEDFFVLCPGVGKLLT